MSPCFPCKIPEAPVVKSNSQFNHKGHKRRNTEFTEANHFNGGN